MERNDLYELCHNFTDAFHVLKCWFSKVHDSTSPLFLFGAASLVAEPVYIAFLCKSLSRQIFLLCPFAVIVSCLEVSAFVKTAFFFCCGGGYCVCHLADDLLCCFFFPLFLSLL